MQVGEETSTGAKRLMRALAELVVRAAVSVALKAEVAAAGILTDAEAVGVGLVLVKVTAQMEPRGLFRVVCRRAKDAPVDETAPPLPVKPVGKSSMAFSAGADSALLPIPIAVMVNAAAGFTTAGPPFEMMPAFLAEATQVNLLEGEPKLTEMKTTFAGGSVNIPVAADGPLPVNAGFHVALLFAATDTDDNAKVSCAKRGLPNKTGSVTTKIA